MSIADKLTTVAENVSKVYEAGKRAEHDRFWDAYQENGAVRSYTYDFHGSNWNDANFYPKYDIMANGNGNYIFSSMKITDVKKRLEECGVVLDTSQCTTLIGVFAYCPEVTHIPEVSTVSCTSSTAIDDLFCNDYKLHTIDKLVLREEGDQKFNAGVFRNCYELRNITIEGTIGQNGFNVYSSDKMLAESIISIVNALSATTSGLTVTLSKIAVNNIDWTATKYGSFQALADTKRNWNIALL